MFYKIHATIRGKHLGRSSSSTYSVCRLPCDTGSRKKLEGLHSDGPAVRQEQEVLNRFCLQSNPRRYRQAGSSRDLLIHGVHIPMLQIARSLQRAIDPDNPANRRIGPTIGARFHAQEAALEIPADKADLS